MSQQIPTAFVQMYKSNVTHLVQQKGSKLRNAVRIEDLTGEFQFFDRIGPTEAQDVNERHGDTPLVNTPHDRRRVSGIESDWADLLDKQDQPKLLIDPTSAYTMNAMWAMGRKMDDRIIEAAFGSAWTGKTGSTEVTFPASQIVAVNDHTYDTASGNVGLTISKLLSAKEILGDNDVDEEEEFFIACKQKQINQLLATTEVGSADYNTVKALAKGEIDVFMGFKFIRTNRITTDSNGYVRVMAWAKSGLLLAVAKDMNVDIGPRRDKRNATQVYVCMQIGATRMEEEKVVEIKCTA